MNRLHYLVLLLICYLLMGPSAATRSWAQQQSKSADLTFCELVGNPAKYDGQRVTVYAYYSYFFEITWIFCWECKDKGQTWLAIPIDDDDAASRSLHRELAKLPQGHGVISGRFTGVFHAGGPYGHMGAYRNKFELQDLSQVKVVIQDTVSQENCSCQKLLKH